MSAEWYYTTNKTQMGPVTWAELRELADGGLLKPHDMVWTDGMDEWVKAINQTGLFADDSDEAGIAAAPSASSKRTAKPPPARRVRGDEDDEDDEESEPKSKKTARQREEERYKRSVGVRIVLTLAGVALLIVLLVGCIGGLVWIAWPKGGAAPVRDNFTWNNLPQGKHLEKNYTFTQGRRVVITVNNTLAHQNANVDLMIFRGNEQNVPIFADRRLPQFDRNCRLEFNVPATDTYRLRVANFGPGFALSCRVSVDEQ